jgi:error-prone DNA polymerase
LPSAEDLLSRSTGDQVSFAGVVICRQRPENASGALFMTLEDETGFVNVVVWRKTYHLNRQFLLTHAVLGITGKLQKNGNAVYIDMRECWELRVPGLYENTKSRDFH